MRSGAGKGVFLEMRILFYLPAIGSWWFEKIVMPMLRTLASDPGVAQIHVMAAPPWRSSGLDSFELVWLSGMAKVQCHIIDTAAGGRVAENFRFNGAAVPGLLKRIKAINADITLARTADPAFCRKFPGRVRFLTEAAASPYPTDARAIILEEGQPFQRGHFPSAATAFAGSCAQVLDAIAMPRLSAAQARDRLGLTGERPVIAVPLQWEHCDNFFLRLAGFQASMDLIRALLMHTAPEVLLAISDHPLNRGHLDRSGFKAALAAFPDRIVLCDQDGATPLLAACADVMVSDLSKSWSLAAWYGTPVVDVGLHPAAGWINAVPGLADLPRSPRRADLPVADREAAALWFGWHLGARMLDPGLISLDGLLRRFDDQPGPDDFRLNRQALEHKMMVMA